MVSERDRSLACTNLRSRVTNATLPPHAAPIMMMHALASPHRLPMPPANQAIRHYQPSDLTTDHSSRWNNPQSLLIPQCSHRHHIEGPPRSSNNLARPGPAATTTMATRTHHTAIAMPLDHQHLLTSTIERLSLLHHTARSLTSTFAMVLMH